jgi:phosphatidylserine/phosphatidylglycerophosphate/cardiolipin synthase-like enzyme
MAARLYNSSGAWRCGSVDPRREGSRTVQPGRVFTDDGSGFCGTLRRVRPLEAELLFGEALYREVILRRMAQARESVWMSTANLKAMYIEQAGEHVPILQLFRGLAERGVELRLLHAELPSRPFRAAFDKEKRLVRGGLALKVCPRVHFKCVVVDGAWAYLGSANLTGAGLGAKHADKRNFELGFVTEDFDVIDRVQALFSAVWDGAECRTCRLRSSCPDPLGPAATTRSRRRRREDEGIVLGRTRRLSLP